MNRRGEILVENVIFIILNIIFIGIMTIFLVNQSSGALILEEKYSKQIALIVDSSRSGMSMEINMQDLYNECKDRNFPFSKAVSFSNNQVIVKLSDEGGYSYHYFNNVNVSAYPALDEKNMPTGNYILTINKNEE